MSTIEAELREMQNVATNGNKVAKSQPPSLPADRAKAVEYGLTQFQQIGHERDAARAENATLRDKISALQITNEGLSSQLTEASSNLRSAMIIRDQALADRIMYESLFVSIQAQLRAFAVPAEPFIKSNETE